ncbi:MAG: AmpG family muropeptide MFS transporter [Gemmatales bacterium]|nr:MAG: AmpG family muropeptide MFS transporter [Gemmatales bacterium]
MALADSRWQRTTLFCAMYVAQGIPWGFMLITLPSFLSANFHVGDKAIGTLKGIILVPWSFKLIWAPLMETFTVPSMGRRRPWIIAAELMMAVTLLGLLVATGGDYDITILCVMYFVHNCFASLQDVCTDALAVDILPAEEQGRMNGLMWGSKLIGKGVGAAVLAYILERWGLEICVLVQFSILIGLMMFPLFFIERAGDKFLPWSPGSTMTSSTISVPTPRDYLRSFSRAYGLPTLQVFVVFTVFKLIASGINEVATNTLYTQHLGWSAVQYSTVAGMYVLLPQMAFAVFGGFLADRIGRRKVMIIGFGGYGILAMIFAALPGLWTNRIFASAYVIACEGLLAAGSVGFLSMAMRLSWTQAAATVFTTLMTLSNVGHVVGNFVAGYVRDFFKVLAGSGASELPSYALTFWFVGVASFVPLVLLLWVRPSQVDEAKKQEMETHKRQVNTAAPLYP